MWQHLLKASAIIYIYIYIYIYVYLHITFNLYYCYITVLLLPALCPLPHTLFLLAYYFQLILLLYNCASTSNTVPFPLYGIRATLFWSVIVLLCSLSLRLCLLETLVLRCCVPFLPSLAPPYYYYYYYYYYYFTGFGTLLYVHKH